MKILLALFVLYGLAAAAERPNIIVIYTDDHGWPDIGAAGIYDDLKTPNIDALAASGVRATNGYSTAPQCVPSRAGLLAGRAQNRFGVESNGEALGGFDDQETIAERLKKADYATGQIGKWHLGPNPEIPKHGFDDVYSKNSNRPCHANYNLAGETIDMQQVDDGLYHLDACTQAALTFIRRHEKEPFFLYLAYRAPHVPLDAPEKYLSRFPGKMPERRRQALAMISAMDDGVGLIVDELKSKGLHDNTLIFYIGDNGAPLKIHKLDAPGGGPGWDGSLNAPMNGEKGMLAEGGMRVPYLVSWPAKIPAGQVYELPLSTLDVAATAIAAAGLPGDDLLDGADLRPYLSGEKKSAPHEFLTWRWIAQTAVREGKWKLLRGGSREYLFDLDADPRETRNLLAANPETAQRLRARLESWASELDPPGLETKTMSSTWEDYYDFYLDGKPAAPRTKTAEPKSVHGWIARGVALEMRDDALHLKPEKEGKQTPFIVVSDIEISGPITAKVKLRASTAGDGGFAWRLKGQKEFPANQTAKFPIAQSADWQEQEIEFGGSGTVIHVRLLLPRGEHVIESVRFFDSKGNVLKSWDFSRL